MGAKLYAAFRRRILCYGRHRPVMTEQAEPSAGLSGAASRFRQTYSLTQTKKPGLNPGFFVWL